MPSFQTLFCVAIAISPIWAIILYDDIKVNIFDHELRDFELQVAASTAELKDFFSRHDFLLAAAASGVALRLMPYIGIFEKFIPLLGNTIRDQSKWRTAFTKATHHEIMHQVSESEVRWMETTIQTVQSKIKLLKDENSDDENRRTIASIIHTELNRMINFFAFKSSLLRKYPLVGAPPLLQLASLVAIFSPIAHELVPLEAMNPQISCKMLDVLLDYRPRVVMARLRKLYGKVSVLATLLDNQRPPLIEVMSLSYNEYGYNSTNPPIVDCNWGCDSNKMRPSDVCVIDRFGTEIYSGRNIGIFACFEGYAALLRHRAEKLFPIELLNSLCIDRKPQVPTGYGWFTINLLNTYFYGYKDDLSSIYLPPGCKPFIKLFVNDELVKKSPTRKDGILHTDDTTFETAKIPKNSTIRLEIWQAGSVFWSSEKLIFSTEGDIESFLNKPIRKGISKVHTLDNVNSIETMSFWLNEYK